MNKDQAANAAANLATTYFPFTKAEKGDGISYAHLAYMVDGITEPDMSECQAMRWLGYIQGVLVARDVATLEEMKEVNRRAVYGPPKTA